MESHYLNYLRHKNDYLHSKRKLGEIIRRYLEHIPGFEENFERFLDYFILAIYYLGDNEISVCEAASNSLDRFFYRKVNADVVSGQITNDLKHLDEIYPYLHYYNKSGKEISKRDCFSTNVHAFLMHTGIWRDESDESYSDWQYEWDIEYKMILNIAYHCSTLEEVDEVYKFVWLYMVSDERNLDDEGIAVEGKLIWENLDLWRSMMDQCNNSQ